MGAMADGFKKAFTAVHESVFRASKGKIGGRLYDMPVLVLTTTGRKSGEPRTSMVCAALEPGGSLVLVGSNGGDSREPQWFGNLRANPEAEVLRGGVAKRYRARVLDDTERDAIWVEITAAHKNFAEYQTKTDRKIPVAVLDPA